ncbi:MAG TPA: hypothetical protein VIK94_03260 [Bacilli bacterium]
MKRKVFVGLLIVLLFLIITLTTKTIKAWLTDTKTTEEISFTLGKVEYTWYGEVTSSPVVPGENIITTPYQLQNLSSIPTELRLKLFFDSSSNDVSHLFDQITLSNHWVLNDDGYYYFQNVITPENQEIRVLENLVLDGKVVNNDYSGSEISIRVLFEAKQAEYVSWEQLGTANINLG